MCKIYAFQRAEVSWEISESSDSSTLDGCGEGDVQRALSNMF